MGYRAGFLLALCPQRFHEVLLPLSCSHLHPHLVTTHHMHAVTCAWYAGSSSHLILPGLSLPCLPGNPFASQLPGVSQSLVSLFPRALLSYLSPSPFWLVVPLLPRLSGIALSPSLVHLAFLLSPTYLVRIESFFLF